MEESRYHQALVNAERLAAVGQTIAALSHHIKNIMQGVRFGADMVRTALKDEDKDLLGKGWKLVERNQGRIDQLILDMLSYSKEREPAVEPTDLNKLCEDVLETGPRPRGRSRHRAGLAAGDGRQRGAVRPGGHPPRGAEHREQRARRGRRPAEPEGRVCRRFWSRTGTGRRSS